MRVLHFTAMWPTPERPTNGTFVKALVEGLRRTGGVHDILVIPFKQSKPGYLGAFSLLKKKLHEKRYDLVHAQYAHCALIAGLASQTPVIAHYHGEFGYRDGQQRVADWTGFINRLDYRKDAFLARISSVLVDGAIVVNSDDLDRVVCHRKTVIPIGPDEKTFVPMEREEACTRLGWDPSPLRILFPSSPRRPEKNYALFHEVVKRLWEGGVEVEPVILQGVPYEQVPLYMNAVDLMLLTSRTEASATVIKEANFCNLPVIACPTGDAALQLAGVSSGGVYPPRAEMLIEAAIPILQARERSDGRKKAEEWGLQRSVQAVCGFYCEMLSGK